MILIFDYFLRKVVRYSVPNRVSNFPNFVLQFIILVVLLKYEVLQVKVLFILIDVDTKVIGYET